MRAQRTGPASWSGEAERGRHEEDLGERRPERRALQGVRRDEDEVQRDVLEGDEPVDERERPLTPARHGQQARHVAHAEERDRRREQAERIGGVREIVAVRAP